MNEMVTLEAGQSIRALTAQDLMNRVERIREVQVKVMKEGVDYGTIQGCGDKPTLFKPGAETLLLAFEMAALPDQLTINDLGDGDEVRYRVICPIVHVPTGKLCGNGVGECSSLEEKYKWRKAVCDEEFEATDPDRRRLKFYKDGGTVNQVRTNKADVANTVLKMAKKRSLVDGSLTVTAASRVFTQDVEDLPEELRNGEPAKKSKSVRSNEPCVPNYGPDAGKPFSAVSLEHLRDYLAGAERSINDPKKANFLRKNENMRDAIKAELAKREQPAPPTGAAESGTQDGLKAFSTATDDAVEANHPVSQDAASPSSVQDYLTKIKLSQSVRECSTVGNAAEADERLSPAELVILRGAVSKKMKELGAHK